MMAIIERIWFFVVVMPVLMFIEGVQMFQRAIREKHYLDALLYVLLFLLILTVVILLFLGFRL